MHEDEKDRELEENPPREGEDSFEEYPEPASELSWGDRLLVQREELSPRHRKLCELAAQGKSNKEIKAELGYKSDSQVSIILSNTRVRAEIDKLKERIWEETIGTRLKKMAEPALAEIERCLNDKSNRYKENLKIETSKWIIEKLDGKPMQKMDIGENMLSVLMDRLDSMKSAGAPLGSAYAQSIDVTPRELSAPESDTMQNEPRKPKTEDEELSDWFMEYDNASR